MNCCFFRYKLHNQPKAQRATDYERWWDSEAPYRVHFEEQYEPYVVVRTKDNPFLPGFDARFRGYGWNKVAFISELHTAGFQFYVLPHCWLVHRSHDKTLSSERFAFSIRARVENRVLRFEWENRIKEKYE